MMIHQSTYMKAAIIITTKRRCSSGYSKIVGNGISKTTTATTTSTTTIRTIVVPSNDIQHSYNCYYGNVRTCHCSSYHGPILLLDTMKVRSCVIPKQQQQQQHGSLLRASSVYRYSSRSSDSDSSSFNSSDTSTSIMTDSKSGTVGQLYRIDPNRDQILMDNNIDNNNNMKHSSTDSKKKKYQKENLNRSKKRRQSDGNCNTEDHFDETSSIPFHDTDNKINDDDNIDPNNCIKLQICHSEYDMELLHPNISIFDTTDDDMYYITAQYTMKDIQQKVISIFDTFYQLQYYDTVSNPNQPCWKFLTNLHGIKEKHCGIDKEPLRIRVPQYFHFESGIEESQFNNNNYNVHKEDVIQNHAIVDDNEDNDKDDDSDNDNDDEDIEHVKSLVHHDYDFANDVLIDNKNSIKNDRIKYRPKRYRNNNNNNNNAILDDNFHTILIEHVIKEMVLELHRTGYVRYSNQIPYTITLRQQKNYDNTESTTTSTLSSTTKSILLTQDWVLQQANTNTEYQSILLQHCNILYHIVQCIHYNILWKRLDNKK